MLQQQHRQQTLTLMLIVAFVVAQCEVDEHGVMATANTG